MRYVIWRNVLLWFGIRRKRSYEVFICYRRSDSEKHVVGMHEWLKSRFGEDRVFLDSSGFERGRVWRKDTETLLNNAKVVLAVLYNNWIENWNPISISADDPVLKELQIAFENESNGRCTVIPVHLDGKPTHEELKQFEERVSDATLRLVVMKLRERTRCKVRLNSDFSNDMDVVSKSIVTALDHHRSPRRVVNTASLIAIVGVVLLGAFLFAMQHQSVQHCTWHRVNTHKVLSEVLQPGDLLSQFVVDRVDKSWFHGHANDKEKIDLLRQKFHGDVLPDYVLYLAEIRSYRELIGHLELQPSKGFAMRLEWWSADGESYDLLAHELLYPSEEGSGTRRIAFDFSLPSRGGKADGRIAIWVIAYSPEWAEGFSNVSDEPESRAMFIGDVKVPWTLTFQMP